MDASALAAICISLLLIITARIFLYRKRRPSSSSLTTQQRDENPKDRWPGPGVPLSARWLAALWTSAAEKVPYVLRGGVHASGLKSLTTQRLWLELHPDSARLRHELQMKRALLCRANGDRGGFFNTVCAREEGKATLPSQLETLDMVLKWLLNDGSRRRQAGLEATHRFFDMAGKVVEVGLEPNQSHLSSGGVGRGDTHRLTDGGSSSSLGSSLASVGSVEVLAAGGGRHHTHRLQDWSDAPIALACMLVQEDFILLEPRAVHPVPLPSTGAQAADGSLTDRPRPPHADVVKHTTGSSTAGGPDQNNAAFVFVAGAACFAFSEVGLRGERGYMKLGSPLRFIHTMVPGFAAHILGKIERAFHTMRQGQASWRVNWSLAPSGRLSPFEGLVMGSELNGESEDLEEESSPVDPPSPLKRPSAPPPDRPSALPDAPAAALNPACTIRPTEPGAHVWSRLSASDGGVVYSTEGTHAPDLWLKVEHQTLHKLSTGAVLFTVRTYADQLHQLVGGALVGKASSCRGTSSAHCDRPKDRPREAEGAQSNDQVGPHACEMLARTIRSLTPHELKYRDLNDDERREGLLEYLDGVADTRHN